MTRTMRAAATAMATAFVLSTLLAMPILAAKPTGGGGGGGTTTTTFSATATAASQYTIVVGAITKVTFTYRWSNGLNRTLRLQVPSSYAAPQDTTAFTVHTGEGAGWVVPSAVQPSGACGSAALSVGTNTVSVTTGDCSSGSFAFDYYAQASATGGAKFPVYADLGTTKSTTAYVTLTLNASSAKVAITGIAATDGSVPATFNAGDVVRVTARVTDAKSKTPVALVGVPLTFTDNGLSDVLGGALACPGLSDPAIVCSNSTGTAWMDFRVLGANQHQVRAAIGSYSGQKSFSVAAGPLAAIVLSSATTGDLALGETRLLTATGTDAYDNALGLATTDLAWSTDGVDGDVTLTDDTANPDGSVSVTATGATTGDVTVTVESVEDAGIADATTFTVAQGAVASFALTGDAGNLTTGDTRTFTVHAENAFGTQIALMADDVDWTTATGQETLVSFAGDIAADGDVSVVVTGEAMGTVEVIATLADAGLSDSTTFTVEEGAIASLAIDGSEADLTSGGYRTFTVSAANTFGRTVTLDPAAVTWTTGDGGDAFVSIVGTPGLSIELRGEFTGGVTLTATVGDASANSTFDVIAGDLATLDLTADTTVIALEGTAVLTVRGYDAKGNVVTLTAAGIDWTTDTGEEAYGTLGGETDAAGDGSVSITLTGTTTDGLVHVTVADAIEPTRTQSLTVTVGTPI